MVADTVAMIIMKTTMVSKIISNINIFNIFNDDAVHGNNNADFDDSNLIE